MAVHMLQCENHLHKPCEGLLLWHMLLALLPAALHVLVEVSMFAIVGYDTELLLVSEVVDVPVPEHETHLLMALHKCACGLPSPMGWCH